MTEREPIRLAVVGDIHGSWTDADTRWFESADYDCVLVVGDLAGWRWSGVLELAERLGAMQCPTLIFPGNHDASSAVSMANEALTGVRRIGQAYAAQMVERRQALAEAVSPHPLCGYGLHQVGDLTIVACRPHSMGGRHLSFAEMLTLDYGIDSMEASAARLCELVDEAGDDLVFLAHNGPLGLGGKRDAIWGADFKRGAGDWGDSDLTAAIDHARKSKKRVHAVLAGHMHRKLRGGGERPGILKKYGTVYVNAAEVPRIRAHGHHHVSVTIGDTVVATDRWVRP